MRKGRNFILFVFLLLLSACSDNDVIIKEQIEEEQPQQKILNEFQDASFLRDPTKTYTYEYSDDTFVVETIKSENANEQIWNQSMGDGSTKETIMIEEKDGLMIGDGLSESPALRYPIELGQTWQQCNKENECMNYEIVALLDYYTTSAGKFADVVRVKSSDGRTAYYAKEVGLIYVENQNKEALVQLRGLQEFISNQTAAKEPVYHWDEVLDTAGGKHKVDIVPIEEKSYPSDMTWAGANEFDLIREGSYEFRVDDIKQSEKIGDWLFNMERNSGRVIGSKPNFIVVKQTESSNSYSSKLFYIHDEKIVEVKDTDGNSSGFFYSGDHVYPLSEDTFLTAWYNNADVELYYELYTYKITDFATGKTELIKEDKVSLEESEAYFQQFEENLAPVN
ncbi:hypothetical protein P9D43_27090 [Neobacillus niacini]|uniref:hypothetical protein n=1 Tax=Neobacillus niacini TaxID=86668 RepID=UPI0007AB8500|nr:hypothetical protein [Neobacillus niacini]MEC1525673.1 hypothetical protein [Neobacillus niacini]